MNYWRFRMLYRIAERRPRQVSVFEFLTRLAAVCGLIGRSWAVVWRSVTAAFFSRG